eukprot:5666196-Amphidinium_carterae.1
MYELYFRLLESHSHKDRQQQSENAALNADHSSSEGQERVAEPRTSHTWSLPALPISNPKVSRPIKIQGTCLAASGVKL